MIETIDKGRILIGVALLVSAGIGNSPPAAAGTTTPLQFTVLPGVVTHIAAQDSPNSDCGLAAANSSPSMLSIATDAQGLARFDVIQGQGSAAWTLECKGTDGATRAHGFTVTASTTEPAFVAPPTTVIGTPRPALAGDPTKPTMRQLMDAGYPPRPDPTSSPKEYARWLADVSTPTTRVGDIGRPGPLSHVVGSEGHPIWAGYAIDDTYGPPYGDSNIPFVSVQAEWYVPVLDGYAEPAFSNSQGLSVWPGLGADRAYDMNNVLQVVQAGSQSFIQCPTSPYSCVYSYESWWQWYSPNMLDECPLAGTTKAGDELYVVVFTYSNSTGNYDASSSAMACFYVSDETQTWYFDTCYPPGDSVCGHTATLPSTYPGGSSIEWIAERAPQIRPLPEFDEINMFNISGMQYNFGLGEQETVNVGSYGVFPITMYNDSPPLITGVGATGDTLAGVFGDTSTNFYIYYENYE
jgi:hypothetical protein